MMACDGRLIIDEKHVCDTVEHSFYRIAEGTYRIALHYNKELGRKVPVLIPMTHAHDASAASTLSAAPSNAQSVALPTTPSAALPVAFLSMGNGIYNVHDSRIILGTHIIPGCVKHSYESFKLLYDRINNSIRRGNNVTLMIE